MLEFIVIVLSIAFFLYAILGGADFGAGVLELFTGNKSIKPIYKAIAPVWEANHMWLILAVVIIFNGFPNIYAEMSTSLHIPLFIILIGIIMRGTAFTFRHYDTHEDESHKYYHFFFRTSSLLTSLFLGITLGAMILGWVTDSNEVSFYERYIRSWFNPFCIAVGFFSTALFAYIASIYIIGETETEEEQKYFSKIAIRFGLITMILGAIVLALAFYYEAAFIATFFENPISIASFGIATILMFFIWRGMNLKQFTRIRILVATQAGIIMLGWQAIQMPIILYLKNGNHLTLYNAAAPDSTLYYLCIALGIGSSIIFPLLFFLFKTFKS